MKWIAVIFYFLISKVPAHAQQWETISGSIKEFYIKNDSVLSNYSIYKKDEKYIMVEKPAEKDFTRLFANDTSAFDVIFDKGPQNPFDFHYDSLVCTLLGVSQLDLVVDLFNRKFEIGKNSIKWILQSSLMSSPPGCYKTITLRRTRKNQTWSYKLVDVTGFCLIP